MPLGSLLALAGLITVLVGEGEVALCLFAASLITFLINASGETVARQQQRQHDRDEAERNLEAQARDIHREMEYQARQRWRTANADALEAQEQRERQQQVQYAIVQRQRLVIEARQKYAGKVASIKASGLPPGMMTALINEAQEQYLEALQEIHK